MKLMSSEVGSDSLPLYTARRKPSAAASVNSSPLISTFTPVSTGRESSVAAAKATCVTASRNTWGSMRTTEPDSTVGIGGKSAASVPLI